MCDKCGQNVRYLDAVMVSQTIDAMFTKMRGWIDWYMEKHKITSKDKKMLVEMYDDAAESMNKEMYFFGWQDAYQGSIADLVRIGKYPISEIRRVRNYDE